MGRFRSALLALGLIAALAAPSFADPACFGLCSVDCVKPISIPDRWDDVSILPGTAGWAGNGIWDTEKFTDTNANGLRDPGEPFIDGSSAYSQGHGALDGTFDAEYYDPVATGYVASNDLGTQIVFKQGSLNPGQTLYYSLALGNQTISTYRQAWSGCSPVQVTVGGSVQLSFGDLVGPTVVEVRNLILLDPTATWDAACQCPAGPMGEQSPRIFVFCAHDPRIPLSAGSLSIKVTKLIGFFLESSNSSGDITGRFARIHRTGDNTCSTGGDFVIDCAVPTLPRTWGGVKAMYR